MLAALLGALLLRIDPPGDVPHTGMALGSEKRFNFELGFFVASPIMAAGRVQPGQLPAVKVARTIYHGGYEGLPAAWGKFMAWIEAKAYTPATDLWEWYVIGPHISENPADWRTELNRPVLE